MFKLRYDEVSPVTKNLSVLIEQDPISGDSVKLCMESGYQTYQNAWKKENEEILRALEAQFPSVVIDSKFVDEEDSTWYLTFLISPNVILFPTEDHWNVGELSSVRGEGTTMPVNVPINASEQVEKFLVNDSVSRFGRFDFGEALYEFQTRIAKIRKNEN